MFGFGLKSISLCPDLFRLQRFSQIRAVDIMQVVLRARCAGHHESLPPWQWHYPGYPGTPGTIPGNPDTIPGKPRSGTIPGNPDLGSQLRGKPLRQTTGSVVPPILRESTSTTTTAAAIRK
eukprot:1722767-Rhodomonas_salina.1